MGTESMLLWGLLFGSIGLGYFVYGRRPGADGATILAAGVNPSDSGIPHQLSPLLPVDEGLGVLMDFFTYFTAVVEDRKQHPRNDLASILANALVDGQSMEQLDQISYFIITATAGHDTTSATISGGMKALIEHPDQLTKLKENPLLANQAAREMIRWVSPVRHMMRTSTEDIVLRGKSIKAGDSLCLWYPSANRDSDAIDNPDTFDIQRDNRNQLAFGQHLAILEVELFFKELLPRLRHIELAGDPDWVQAIFVGGLKSMPVRYSFGSG
jgi:cytochrome P450